MSRPSTLLAEATELLGDGEWHDFDEIVSKLARLVPPGVALRLNEQQRASAMERRSGEAKPRVKPVSRNRAIELGRRAAARGVLSNSKRFEIEPRRMGQRRADEKKRVRMIATPPTVARDRARLLTREQRVAVAVSAADLLVELVEHKEREKIRLALAELERSDLEGVVTALAKIVVEQRRELWRLGEVDKRAAELLQVAREHWREAPRRE